ncbi:MAG TPA: hypothetical protein VE441_15170, partial [Mycobacterium sp.]|nr:hypothetical protein [Mycobacterium sp.]
SRSPSGGITVSAPHIACRKGNVQQTYDGGNTHPVELCLMTGAVAHIRINPPAGKTWPTASASPSTVVKPVSSRRMGNAIDVTLEAHAKGTATLAVPDKWKLTIAVV